MTAKEETKKARRDLIAFDDSLRRWGRWISAVAPPSKRQLTAFPMNLLSRSFATPSTGLYPVGEVGSGTGWFSDEPVQPVLPLGSRRKTPGGPLRKRVAPCFSSPVLPPPSPASPRPLEQRKVTFVSTRSRLSNEEPRRFHSCDRTSTLWSTVNTLFPNRFGYNCRFYGACVLERRREKFLWLLISSNLRFSIRKSRITLKYCV